MVIRHPSNQAPVRYDATMLPDGRRLGAHLPLGHGMLRAVDRAVEIGADTLQVFSANPTAWRRRAEPPDELPRFRERLAAEGLAPIAIHAPYLLNLASPDETVRGRSIELLAHELRVAPTFSARWLNIHLGSHMGHGTEAGIRRLGESVATALGAVPGGSDAAVLVLENAAGSGDSLGSTIDELGRIVTAIESRGVDPDRVALCLDTAHAWSAGWPLADAEGVDEVLGLVDHRLGLDRVALVHLNDSRSECGSRTDRHQHLGAGRIGVAGLRRILTHPRLRHATYLLETPGMDEGYDAINLDRARRIATGERLPKLPRGAGLVRGGRRAAGPPERASA